MNLITEQELVLNLEILRGKIARKPIDYIFQDDFPIQIEDSLSKYVITHHVNLILSISDVLRVIFDWPFPFFILSFRKSKIWSITVEFPLTVWSTMHVLIESRIYQASKEVQMDRIKTIIDRGMVKLVRLSSRKLFLRWMSSEILAGYQHELMEIKQVYTKGYWYPCVTAVFPLLDYICRKLLRTKNLTKGVSYINKLFSDANISFESLRPGYGAWDYAETIGENPQEASNKDLRLVGIALESFLQFSKGYYSHCDQDQNIFVLNRHSILHGGRGKVWTKEDATKLLLFLDLMISLFPVFEILLVPNQS